MENWCKVCFWYDICKRHKLCKYFVLSSTMYDYFDYNTIDLGNLKKIAERLIEVRSMKGDV